MWSEGGEKRERFLDKGEGAERLVGLRFLKLEATSGQWISVQFWFYQGLNGVDVEKCREG